MICYPNGIEPCGIFPGLQYCRRRLQGKCMARAEVLSERLKVEKHRAASCLNGENVAHFALNERGRVHSWSNISHSDMALRARGSTLVKGGILLQTRIRCAEPRHID